MNRRFCIWMTAAVVCATVGVLSAAPEPAEPPRSWELDFAYHDIQRISLVLPGDRKPTTFWYVLYTVTNNTGADVEFYPSAELVTGSLQVTVGGDQISPSVYDAIEARHRKIYPFFRNPSKVSGKLLQGPDNARTSAAVFRDFTPEADSFTIYLAGLSGEIASVPNPRFDAEQPESPENRRFFALRKTLAIKYDLPGDPGTRPTATPIQRGKEWVMR